MTPEQTLDWLAEQHKSQCNEDRPVQEWIRSMKSMLPAPVQEPHKSLSEHITQATNGRVYVDPVTGDVGIGTPVAQPVYTQEDLGRAFSKGFIEGEKMAIFEAGLEKRESAPVQSAERVEPVAWVGLTDEEISEIEDEYIVDYRIPAGCSWNFAKHIEAKLKAKNSL